MSLTQLVLRVFFAIIFMPFLHLTQVWDYLIFDQVGPDGFFSKLITSSEEGFLHISKQSLAKCFFISVSLLISLDLMVS